MARDAARDLARTPEFKALEAAYRAMKPLDPEGRRRVVEALHTLLKVSPGRGAAAGGKGPGPKAARRR